MFPKTPSESNNEILTLSPLNLILRLFSNSRYFRLWREEELGKRGRTETLIVFFVGSLWGIKLTRTSRRRAMVGSEPSSSASNLALV